MASIFAVSWFVVLLVLVTCILMLLDHRAKQESLQAKVAALENQADVQARQIKMLGQSLWRVASEQSPAATDRGFQRLRIMKPEDPPPGVQVDVEFEGEATEDTPSARRWLDHVLHRDRPDSDTPAPYGQRVPRLPSRR